MFEQVLKAEETIALQAEGIYCGGGPTAAIGQGLFALTNKRLIVLKNPMGNLGFIIGLIIMIPAFIVNFRFMTRVGLGYLEAGLLGALIGVVAMLAGHFIAKAIYKKGGGPNKKAEIVYAISLEEIIKVEDGQRGVQKMVAITTKSGDVCKIGGKIDREAWRAAISKSIAA